MIRLMLNNIQSFKEYFYETCDFDFFLEMSTVAQYLKQHPDRELVKLLKHKIYIRMGQLLPWFVMNPEGQKVKDRYINFFTNQVLQDPSWLELAAKALNNPIHQTGRWEIPTSEIKEQLANNGVGTFQHMITRNNSGIADYIVAMGSRLSSKINSPSYSWAQLKQDADEWHEELAARERGLPNQEAKTLLTLDHLGGKWKGWKWVDLETPYCSQEGDAMGHCGNASGYENDTILSLRDPEGYAHLTFILNNGVLGEAKGRGNQKPSEKYHDPIVELLKTEHIKLIKGGGYLPENNFSLNDLNKDRKEKLKHKENLDDPIGYIMQNNKTPEDIVGALNEFLDITDFEDFDGENFVLEKYENFEEIEDSSKRWASPLEGIGWLDEPYHHMDGSHHGLSLSEMLDKLNKENKTALENYYKEERPEDYEEMDLEELIEEDDDVKEALERAAINANESSIESEAYENIRKQLSDPDENGFFIDFKDHPWKLSINKSDINAMISNVDTSDGEIIDKVDIRYSPPYYGYDGYDIDDDYFNEMASEYLAELNIV